MKHDADFDAQALPAADINMTPLIDVMLVLLVIFMVTLPVLRHEARLALPRVAAASPISAAPHVDLAIDADGRVSWDAHAITSASLDARLAQTARQAPQTEIRLFVDRATPYERVAALLSAASAAGLTKIGFVTERGEHAEHADHTGHAAP
ncbi:biopolymer transporter ExbD [Paraburkholderia sp.]|uniref:ExbD/TolR family protein n=1 Tax=Paraburkholderia sp. TaxID=1926495 RepID=UPI00286F1DAE|nr:biopolymer transporter ExbD [Paraburkholderia sp.]